MTEVATTPGLDAEGGVVVLSGYGLRVAVHRRHLMVSDGIGRGRRSGRFARATSGVKRIVILGRSGIITLDALRWLYDVGAGLIQIDNGDVVAAFGPAGLDDARLRRAQAVASQSWVGVEIARALLREKLKGEQEVLTRLKGSGEALETLASAVRALEVANSLDAMRSIEAQAAATYWQAWADVPVVFARADLPRVPDHWLTFGQRGSPLSGSPRLAANPANAVLNYLYAVLEAETRIACLAVGLDPGMGIVHVDQRGRDSLALDIMEAVRPQVDAFLLELIQKRTFRVADFFENRRGVCRVLPPLTHALAETAPLWAKRVAPVAEQAVRMLLTASGARISRIPTPLTQSNRSAGRDAIRRAPKRPDSSKRYLPPGVCGICGVILDAADRAYCDDCLPEHQEIFERAGPAALRRLRAEGRDPAHGGEAGRKRGASNARRKREAAVWDRTHPNRPGPEVFRREILPGLQGVPLGRIAEATGFTRMYCSLIRRGLYVPHPKHWQALAGLGERP